MSIQIVNYSEKSIAVLGDTKPIKDHLLALGGKFNPSLTWKEERVSGWIFVMSKKDDVKKVLLSYADGSLGDAPVREKKEYQKTETSTDGFKFSKEMYLALVSRIERLENEVAILKRVNDKGEVANRTKPSVKAPVKTNLKFTEDDDDLNISDVDEDEKKDVKSLFKKR